MKIRIALGVTLALASLFAFAPAVEAQETGERAFELYVGYLVPGERELENDTTWGIRYTARHWDQFGWQISAGYMDLGIEGGPDLSASSTRPAATSVTRPASGIRPARISASSPDWATAPWTSTLRAPRRTQSDSGLTYVYGANYTWNFGESSCSSRKSGGARGMATSTAAPIRSTRWRSAGASDRNAALAQLTARSPRPEGRGCALFVKRSCAG